MHKRGYTINPELPLLELASMTCSREEIGRRVLVLHACCAVSYGFPVDDAKRWLNDNSLMAWLSPKESKFLASGKNKKPFKTLPETIWTLGWILSKVNNFNLEEYLPDDANLFLPDLNKQERVQAWLADTALRDGDDLWRARDYYQCLDWAWHDACLKVRVEELNILPCYMIRERRRALEWCHGSEAWDKVLPPMG